MSSLEETKVDGNVTSNVEANEAANADPKGSQIVKTKKMELKELNNDGAFQDFLKFQKEMMEGFVSDSNFGPAILELDDLFKFFNKHFNEFRQNKNVHVMLPFLHRFIEGWIKGRKYFKGEIESSLMWFIKIHYDNEDDLNVVFQIVYQIMNSLIYFGVDVFIEDELLHELITIVTLIKNRNLISCCIACIQMYIKISPESNNVLDTLWSNIKSELEKKLKLGLTKDTEIVILIELIDELCAIIIDFFEEPILQKTIQYLLQSDQRKDRKCAYFLMKKVLHYLKAPNKTLWISHECKLQNVQYWIMYITVLENLEEEQSHLILPSLENLVELIKSQHLESIWLDILYMKMLTHNNNLVLRWSTQFFLNNFSCSDLSENVLKAFLQTTNSNLLYNYEGYFLKTEDFTSFLKNKSNNLLLLLPEIDNWKSIPLYIWLENVSYVELPKSLTYETILKISACVRKLQNCTIRRNAIQICHKLLHDFIENMSMEEYVTFVETLYNVTDGYDDHETCFKKKIQYKESKANSSIFKQRFYEIFANNLWNKYEEFLLFLKDIPVFMHGWLKYVHIQLCLFNHHKDSIEKLYNLQLNVPASCELIEVINTFEKSCLSLPLHDKNEQRECHQTAISFYMAQRLNFDDENESTLSFLIQCGLNKINDQYFAELLRNTQKHFSLSLFEEIFEYDSSNRYVGNYFRQAPQLQRNDIKIIVIKNFEKIKENLYYENILKYCTDEWFKELAIKGENRIEQIFCFERFYYTNDIMVQILAQLAKYGDNLFISNILEYHTDLTKKKPRYFENSNEHRFKLKIATCLEIAKWHIKFNMDVLDKIWNIILNENNQLNVTYFYEYILGKFESRENIIINKFIELHNFTSRQQISIISVVYMYFLRNSTTLEQKNMIITKLLSLSMGANFQIRTLAQMSLYKLLKSPTFECLSSREVLIDSIEYAAGVKLNEYLNDIRLHISGFSYAFDVILYVTNAPFDISYRKYPEFFKNVKMSESDILQISACRQLFMNKFNVVSNDETNEKCSIHEQVQRKMNPVNDLIEPHNLIHYPIEEKVAEMFVIASLIDKLPNLGGIARTCEVLGIQNLVMDSKMHTTKNDFKNLSMTAEKTLNIQEVKPKDLKNFLMKKKLEGYSVVGAEQTSNSQNFSNFKFPQKCVLLLGHEKDGIPAPLLGLLDYAVEIPQFGQVRSLNVHVTGALFMWEFCKQHLVHKQK